MSNQSKARTIALACIGLWVGALLAMMLASPNYKMITEVQFIAYSGVLAVVVAIVRNDI